MTDRPAGVLIDVDGGERKLDRPRDLNQPWRLGSSALPRLGYPPPLVDLDAARQRFQRHRKTA